MKTVPYDQRLARILVAPLARTPVTPNQITAFTLVLALVGAALIARGGEASVNWGAGLFVLARFLDHFDGELARLTGKTSRFGYYFDYAVGGIGYAALFGAMGLGLSGGVLGAWALWLGAAGVVAALLSMILNLDIDRASNDTEGVAAGDDAVGYPALAGFELEDGIYLLAPVAWLGWLMPFFVAASIGAAVYCLWTAATLIRLRAAKRGDG